MRLPTKFEKFLESIRLNKNQKEDLKQGHKTLRERLLADESLGPIIVDTFLQGSYKRHTAVKPINGKRADVDVVVVTNLDKDQFTPNQAMDKFTDFLERHYPAKYTRQGRSIAINLSYVDLDLVITAAPSEQFKQAVKKLAEYDYEPYSSKSLSEDSKWKTEPLWIPDRDAGIWKPTDPLAQMKFTSEKNARCNGHYVNIVKAIKWWQRLHFTEDAPKGYPLERLIGDSCPDGVTSMDEGVTLTLEAIVNQYATYGQTSSVPHLPDHGVPAHNVMHRVSGPEFAKFYKRAADAAKIARLALNSDSEEDTAKNWNKLFGDEFDSEASNKGMPGRPYTPMPGPRPAPIPPRTREVG